MAMLTHSEIDAMCREEIADVEEKYQQMHERLEYEERQEQEERERQEQEERERQEQEYEG